MIHEFGHALGAIPEHQNPRAESSGLNRSIGLQRPPNIGKSNRLQLVPRTDIALNARSTRPIAHVVCVPGALSAAASRRRNRSLPQDKNFIRPVAKPRRKRRRLQNSASKRGAARQCTMAMAARAPNAVVMETSGGCRRGWPRVGARFRERSPHPTLSRLTRERGIVCAVAHVPARARAASPFPTCVGRGLG